MCLSRYAHASSCASRRETLFSPFPARSSALQMVLWMEEHGMSPRGGFSNSNTASSSLLAWMHADFTKLFFRNFIIKGRKMHLLHVMMGRLLSGVIHCSVETNRSADIRHFINSTFICRLIDSSSNCSYDHEVTCLRVYRTRTYNISGAFTLTILAAVNDSLSAVPPAQDFTVYYSGTLLNALCILSFDLFTECL